MTAIVKIKGKTLTIRLSHFIGVLLLLNTTACKNLLRPPYLLTRWRKMLCITTMLLLYLCLLQCIAT